MKKPKLCQAYIYKYIGFLKSVKIFYFFSDKIVK